MEIKDDSINENLQSLLNEKNNYIKNLDEMNYYDIDNLNKKGKIDDLICPICFFILKEPKSCSSRKNSHSFCKECIDKYLSNNNNNCPTCKLNFKYKARKKIINALNKLSFNCCYKNEGCEAILSYSEYLTHIKICAFHDNIFECQIKNYNYERKEFEKCNYKCVKKNMEVHLKIFQNINVYFATKIF